MPTQQIERVIGWLRQDCAWPIPEGSVEDLTFDYRMKDFQFLRNEAWQVESVLRLRTSTSLATAIFLVDFGNRQFSRATIRRICIYFSTRPKTLKPRPFLAPGDIRYLVLSGNELSVVQLEGANGLQASMAVFGPLFPEGWVELKAVMHWDLVANIGISLPPEMFIRFKRTRDRSRCTLQFIRTQSPASEELFSLTRSLEFLTQDEEDFLFEKARKGCQDSYSELVLRGLSAAFDVSYRLFTNYESCSPQFDTIFSGAVEGLVLASAKYEPQQGHRFASFAWQWIQSRAERNLPGDFFPISVPYWYFTTIAERLRKYDAFKALSEYGPHPSSLGTLLSMDDNEVEVMRLLADRESNTISSVELEAVQDDQALEPFSRLAERLSSSELLDLLKPRDQEVLKLRFGLHPDYYGQDMTLESIGQRLHITRERVRHIEKRALKRIQNNFNVNP